MTLNISTFLYLLFTVFNSEYSGDKIYVNSHQDIYRNILINYCDNLEKDSDHIYVESIVSVTDKLPELVNDINVAVIGEKDIFKLSKKNKSIELVRIIPIRMKAERLYVTLLIFDVECHKKKLKYSNKGGFSAEIDQDDKGNFYMVYK
jgi:hypothetical protein